jgi:hypothetical protein
VSRVRVAHDIVAHNIHGPTMLLQTQAWRYRQGHVATMQMDGSTNTGMGKCMHMHGTTHTGMGAYYTTCI